MGPWNVQSAGSNSMATSDPVSEKNRRFRWAVVAALKRELAPLRHCSSPHLLLIETGMGQLNADWVVRQLFNQKAVQAVINIGLAGALSPALQLGDLVIGEEVRSTSSFAPTPALLQAASQVKLDGVRAHTGIIITQDEILWRASDKRRLALELPSGTVGCVDMESAAVATVCDQHQIPFLAVRSISDRLDEDLPADFNRFRGRNGNLAIGKLLASSALHPASLPGLVELRRRTCLCAEHLARFVEQLVQTSIAGM